MPEFGDKALCLWCIKNKTTKCRPSYLMRESGDYCGNYDPTPAAIFSDGIAPEQVRRAQRKFFTELGHK
jgi:hypothetical protein